MNIMMNFDKVDTKKLHFWSETVGRNPFRRARKSHPFPFIFAHRLVHTLRMVNIKAHGLSPTPHSRVTAGAWMKLIQNIVNILMYAGLHWFLQ